jgi:hypothetical protein
MYDSYSKVDRDWERQLYASDLVDKRSWLSEFRNVPILTGASIFNKSQSTDNIVVYTSYISTSGYIRFCSVLHMLIEKKQLSKVNDYNMVW